MPRDVRETRACFTTCNLRRGIVWSNSCLYKYNIQLEMRKLKQQQKGETYDLIRIEYTILTPTMNRLSRRKTHVSPKTIHGWKYMNSFKTKELITKERYNLGIWHGSKYHTITNQLDRIDLISWPTCLISWPELSNRHFLLKSNHINEISINSDDIDTISIVSKISTRSRSSRATHYKFYYNYKSH